MRIQCLFYCAQRASPCDVLAGAGLSEVPGRVLSELQERYCSTGAFIACPVLQRLQDRLAVEHCAAGNEGVARQWGALRMLRAGKCRGASAA